ncbi:GntR family transcriptional regulator [Blastococcus sp. SYSU D00820]
MPGGTTGRLTPAEARSRLVRVKTSATVAEHVLDLLFAGELRAGDRIDIDALATSLGISRAPVREALVSLERDGVVEIRYHRGAFVADFDADAIAEGFELYGVLSALTSRRAAGRRDPAMLADLAAALADVEDTEDSAEFEERAREFRRVLNVAVAGPRLRAMLRSFEGLVPVASRLSIPTSLDEERRLLREEHDAIVRGDGAAAAAAAAEHVRLLGERAVRALRERGVLGAREETPAGDAPAGETTTERPAP